MKTIIDAALNRRRTVLSVLFLLLITGTFSFFNIPKEADPDINIPVIYVSMIHEGISPEDAESLLIRPMEQELQSIEGVKEMNSSGFQGGANVTLEFTAGFDSDKALDDVREKVDRAKPELPEDTDEPVVSEVNLGLFPVLVVTLSGEVSERVMLQVAQHLQDKMEAINTVLEVKIAGDREEQLEIILNPLAMESYGLNGNDILTFFSRSDKLVAAGNLDTGKGRFAIKVPGRFETLKDIREMPLKTNGDSVVRVKDVAEIRRNYKDPESFARVNGVKSIALEVVKRTGENVIETIDAVRRIVEEEQTFWPENIDVIYTQDRSKQIKNMLSDLQNNIFSAIILVMIVCVAALGFVSGSLVGIAIPGAFLSGLLILYMMGLTINIVVLFALILSVGMLVDGAIVVTEYADRKMNEGFERKKAYGLAAKRMSWPIISSTVTTLAAFLPLMFWPGVVGEFMKFLPLTLIVVLLSSLVMALIFVPTLGSLFGRPGVTSDLATAKHMAAADTGELHDLKGFTGKYVQILKFALCHPFKVLMMALMILIGCQTFYAKYGKGVEFFPNVEPEVASVLIHARGNLSIFEQDEIVKKVENRVLKIDGIKTVYTRTGSSGGASFLAEDVIGVIQLHFADWDQRLPAREILSLVGENTADIPGIFVETQEQDKGPSSGKALQLQLRSRHPNLLDEHIIKVRKALVKIGDFIAVEDSRSIPGIEWELKIDRAQAAKFGLDTTSIGQSIRLVTNGLKISEYRPNDADEELDVIIRHSLNERSLDQLDNVRVETSAGSIPISNFVKRVAQSKTGRINRSDGYRIQTIKADLPPGILVDAKIRELEKWLTANGDWNPLVKYKFKGDDEEQKLAQIFLVKAFGVSLFIMAIILVTQFNSFYSAFLILSAVIMSTIGVMIGLLVMGKPFGIVMTGIGVIALAGIIVNNNIVLIDTFDRLYETGKYTVREAILRTGAQRLRPVLLTTVTTGLGLLPMVFQMNIDFITRDISVGAPSTQWWVDLATAVAFGLVFSTPLTLIVTPSAIQARENMAQFFKNKRFKFKKV